MAGSFGYEAEHYSMSKAIASILFDQVDDSAGEHVVAPGTSCQSQLLEHDGVEGKPAHPIQALEDAIVE
jgi:Fe-S oxidoreductase